jgi:hypothetical protein
MFYHYAECHCAECRHYAESHGAKIGISENSTIKINKGSALNAAKVWQHVLHFSVKPPKAFSHQEFLSSLTIIDGHAGG